MEENSLQASVRRARSRDPLVARRLPDRLRADEARRATRRMAALGAGLCLSLLTLHLHRTGLAAGAFARLDLPAHPWLSPPAMAHLWLLAGAGGAVALCRLLRLDSAARLLLAAAQGLALAPVAAVLLHLAGRG